MFYVTQLESGGFYISMTTSYFYMSANTILVIQRLMRKQLMGFHSERLGLVNPEQMGAQFTGPEMLN